MVFKNKHNEYFIALFHYKIKPQAPEFSYDLIDVTEKYQEPLFLEESKNMWDFIRSGESKDRRTMYPAPASLYHIRSKHTLSITAPDTDNSKEGYIRFVTVAIEDTATVDKTIRLDEYLLYRQKKQCGAF